jgi:hypothetical protein
MLIESWKQAIKNKQGTRTYYFMHVWGAAVQPSATTAVTFRGLGDVINPTKFPIRTVHDPYHIGMRHLAAMWSVGSYIACLNYWPAVRGSTINDVHFSAGAIQYCDT